MFVIREVLNCKPGKVGRLLENFKVISKAVSDIGQKPMRLMTDVSGDPFWTLVAETDVERLEDFFALEQKLMANESIRSAMAGYHDLISSGRREIYRLER